jgi:hypothetical protein
MNCDGSSDMKRTEDRRDIACSIAAANAENCDILSLLDAIEN